MTKFWIVEIYPKEFPDKSPKKFPKGFLVISKPMKSSAGGISKGISEKKFARHIYGENFQMDHRRNFERKFLKSSK